MRTFFERLFYSFRVPIRLIYPNVIILALLCALYALADRFGFVSDVSRFIGRTQGGWILVFVLITIALFGLMTLFYRLFDWGDTAPWIEDASSRRGGVWLLDILIVVVSVGMYLVARFLYKPNYDILFVLIISLISALIGITISGNHHVVRGGRETFAALHATLRQPQVGQDEQQNTTEVISLQNLFRLNHDHPLAYEDSKETEYNKILRDPKLSLTPGDEIRLPLGLYIQEDQLHEITQGASARGSQNSQISSEPAETEGVVSNVAVVNNSEANEHNEGVEG